MYGDKTTLFFVKELPFGMTQSKFLMTQLEDEIKKVSFPKELDLIGVGIGPGSYTGIRVGAAVAQTLAYSWKVPLVGISSLEGFVPSVSSVHYSALLDARIGGFYLQKGRVDKKGMIEKASPQLVSTEEIGTHLTGISYLVTPSIKGLQTKLKNQFPEQVWQWEERAPDADTILLSVSQAFDRGEVTYPPNQLNLLYLRQTEAERQKEAKSHLQS